jgi:hypothetical protein
VWVLEFESIISIACCAVLFYPCIIRVLCLPQIQFINNACYAWHVYCFTQTSIEIRMSICICILNLGILVGSVLFRVPWRVRDDGKSFPDNDLGTGIAIIFSTRLHFSDINIFENFHSLYKYFIYVRFSIVTKFTIMS